MFAFFYVMNFNYFLIRARPSPFWVAFLSWPSLACCCTNWRRRAPLQVALWTPTLPFSCPIFTASTVCWWTIRYSSPETWANPPPWPPPRRKVWTFSTKWPASSTVCGGPTANASPSDDRDPRVAAPSDASARLWRLTSTSSTILSFKPPRNNSL